MSCAHTVGHSAWAGDMGAGQPAQAQGQRGGSKVRSAGCCRTCADALPLLALQLPLPHTFSSGLTGVPRPPGPHPPTLPASSATRGAAQHEPLHPNNPTCSTAHADAGSTRPTLSASFAMRSSARRLLPSWSRLRLVAPSARGVPPAAHRRDDAAPSGGVGAQASAAARGAAPCSGGRRRQVREAAAGAHMLQSAALARHLRRRRPLRGQEPAGSSAHTQQLAASRQPASWIGHWPCERLPETTAA